MHLTPKRLEAPGSLEVWLGGGWGVGTFLWRQGSGKEVWDVEQSEGGGGGGGGVCLFLVVRVVGVGGLGGVPLCGGGGGNKIWSVNKQKD